MRYIKLFESFGAVDPVALYEDVRSIAYELEDDGYAVSMQYLQSLDKSSDFYLGHDDKDSLGLARYTNVEDGMLPGYRFRSLLIQIVRPEERTEEEYVQDVDRFVEILKDHLDYVDPNKIRKNQQSFGPGHQRKAFIIIEG